MWYRKTCLGERYGNWEVVDRYVCNKYKKSYNNNRVATHQAYTYILENRFSSAKIKLSGNTLRRLRRGLIFIEDVVTDKRVKYIQGQKD